MTLRLSSAGTHTASRRPCLCACLNLLLGGPPPIRKNGVELDQLEYIEIDKAKVYKEYS